MPSFSSSISFRLLHSLLFLGVFYNLFGPLCLAPLFTDRVYSVSLNLFKSFVIVHQSLHHRKDPLVNTLVLLEAIENLSLFS